MNDIEALDFAISRVRANRDTSEENLYGRRYRDRSKHPERDAIEEILSEFDDVLTTLGALRERLSAETSGSEHAQPR